MKKFSVIALVLVLAVSMCACGKRNNEPTRTTRDTTPTTVPTVPTVTMPSTNIPDPTVDSNSTMGTDGTGSTATDGTGNAINGGMGTNTVTE